MRLHKPRQGRLHQGVNNTPDFFIIGAPKCGTTAMAEYLSQHPDIYMARKEMHFFGSDLEFGTQIYCRDQQAYLKEFSAWNGQSQAGEASVWYLFSKKAAAEIKAFNPQAQIIIMLREPTEMLYSLYSQFRLDGNEHLDTFGEALDAESDRLTGRRITRQTYFRQGLAYREVARYSEQVRRYFEMFGRERVHVVLYDDFAADTAASYRGVLNFLGVDSAQIKKSFHVINPSQTVKSPLLRAIMSDPLVRGTAITTRSWLPRPFFAALQKIEMHLMVFNTRPAKRPQLDAGLRASLKKELQAEVARLGELLGRDLSAWSRTEEAVDDRQSGPDVPANESTGASATMAPKNKSISTGHHHACV